MTTRTCSRAAVAAMFCLTPVLAAAQPAAPPASPPAPAAPAARPQPAADTGRRPQTDVPKESLTAIRARGVLRACIAPYAPWVMAGATEGEYSGFSIDVAKQLAVDLGVEVEFVGTGYPDLIPAVVEGDCDVIPAGLAATPDRALFVHFSSPVAVHEVQLFGPASAVSGAATAADFDKAGVTVGAVGGSAEAQDARRRLPRASVQEFDGPASMAAAVLDGKVTLGVAAAPLPRVIVMATGDRLAIVPERLALRGEAFAVRRGDLEFLAYLNTWVQARMNDGWLQQHADRWFVELDWATPRPGSASRQ